MHVRDMGLRSFSIVLGGQTFGIGLEVALFHIDGRQPSLMLLLKIAHTGGGKNAWKIMKYPCGDVIWAQGFPSIQSK